MIELIEGFPKNVVGISVRGRVTERECREILTPAVQKSLRWRDKTRLYYELGSRFPGSGWDDLDLGFEHASRCERIAIVTDIAWVRLTVKTIRFLIPGDIRVFATLATEEARAWITARGDARRTAEAAPAGRPVDARARQARRLPQEAGQPPSNRRQPADAD
jgi:hypothetical protein